MLNDNNTKCRWCNEPPINSHITPGSLYRVANEKLGPLNLRHHAVPNRVVQDIGKMPLLCTKHDGAFSVEENLFRQKIYVPLLSGATRFKYGEWLTRFAVFIAWKRLVTGMPQLRNLTFDQVVEAQKAKEHWEGYLLNKHHQTEPYKHHLLLTWFYAHAADTPELHRFQLLGSFDTTLIQSPEGLLVWTMFPGCILVSLAAPWTLKGWDTTRINSSGRFDDRQVLPWDYLSPYLQDSLDDGVIQAKKISPSQSEKIKRDSPLSKIGRCR